MAVHATERPGMREDCGLPGFVEAACRAAASVLHRPRLHERRFERLLERRFHARLAQELAARHHVN
eukprot:15071920-Alexandrium_andersonii.AAC.1